MMPFGVSFVKETTIFREYGPVAGSAVQITLQRRRPASATTGSRSNTLDADVRYYKRLVANGVLAVALRRPEELGHATPTSSTSAATPRCAATSTSQFIGQKGFFANAELRFPLIEAMLTPIGVLGGLRGVFFANVGGAALQRPAVHADDEQATELYQPIIGYDLDVARQRRRRPYARRCTIDGFRLVDGRASYGIGLESFLLGFPMHFDWSWKTLFNQDCEDALFRGVRGRRRVDRQVEFASGSVRLLKMKFDFWIGYDF